ncbi:MAG: hypothetical protein JWN73_707 [Betaproteobacteria bacterium]|nr:hypothetical protein [Betaproteobacteria bacterium]
MNCMQVPATAPVSGCAANTSAATREADQENHPGREQAHAKRRASRHPN